ncbi:MAG TPA: alpha/beta hydrolase [Gemmataceae bacterium]|nr:alpha/beta hydrolase [Gemmataceae bacterium]
MLTKDLTLFMAVAATCLMGSGTALSQETRTAPAPDVKAGASAAAEETSFTRKEDVVYGRKYGMALTMDVFTPKKGANGAALVEVVSGGFISSHDNIRLAPVKPFIKRGYTVFAVVHGCQPRFQVPEIVEDMKRSVRFIRHHAREYGIDPERIGATGGSAGGHLSLMLGAAAEKENSKATDPVDRESSRVQAVACFFPPTDFLNFGATGLEKIHPMDYQFPFRASFDYRERDQKTNIWERVTDEDKLRKITRNISPIYFVNGHTAPTLIYHGDKDRLVPVQQSQTFIEKLGAAGVDAKLVVKKGADHGWGVEMLSDLEAFADWFDGHLKKSAAAQKAGGAQ